MESTTVPVDDLAEECGASEEQRADSYKGVIQGLLTLR